MYIEQTYSKIMTEKYTAQKIRTTRPDSRNTGTSCNLHM